MKKLICSSLFLFAFFQVHGQDLVKRITAEICSCVDTIENEGSFSLQNQAVAFTYLKDYESALGNYNKLMNLYPDNPEGYFGAAKIYVYTEDYENALDYAFYTHKMYVLQGSDYVRDTERLITLIHDKMKEQNKLDVFIEKAKKQGITINQDL